jgi:hypothetical protein
MRSGGAIRGYGEYWMGRMRVVWMVNLELQLVDSACVN